MSKRKTNFDESAITNNKTYIDFYDRLKELALNVFCWENLPSSIDERFLELSLYDFGYALYFNDEIMGNLALTCTIGGLLDVYRIPTYRRAYANNGYQKECNQFDSVLIFNNYLHTPTSMTIDLFAKRLYEIQRAIDVNIKGQKTPVLILCSEQQRLTMENFYQKYDGNQPFIFGDKTMEIDSVKSLPTLSPFISDKLQVQLHNTWNDALTFLGIENANADKKERMVSDEVNSNYGNVEAQRNVMLNARLQACDKINAMFGTNINCKFRSELPSSLNLNNVSRETFDNMHIKDGE